MTSDIPEDLSRFIIVAGANEYDRDLIISLMSLITKLMIRILMIEHETAFHLSRILEQEMRYL